MCIGGISGAYEVCVDGQALLEEVVAIRVERSGGAVEVGPCLWDISHS